MLSKQMVEPRKAEIKCIFNAMNCKSLVRVLQFSTCVSTDMPFKLEQIPPFGCADDIYFPLVEGLKNVE